MRAGDARPSERRKIGVGQRRRQERRHVLPCAAALPAPPGRSSSRAARTSAPIRPAAAIGRGRSPAAGSASAPRARHRQADQAEGRPDLPRPPAAVATLAGRPAQRRSSACSAPAGRGDEPLERRPVAAGGLLQRRLARVDQPLQRLRLDQPAAEHAGQLAHHRMLPRRLARGRSRRAPHATIASGSSPPSAAITISGIRASSWLNRIRPSSASRRSAGRTARTDTGRDRCRRASSSEVGRALVGCKGPCALPAWSRAQIALPARRPCGAAPARRRYRTPQLAWEHGSTRQCRSPPPAPTGWHADAGDRGHGRPRQPVPTG